MKLLILTILCQIQFAQSYVIKKTPISKNLCEFQFKVVTPDTTFIHTITTESKVFNLGDSTIFWIYPYKY